MSTRGPASREAAAPSPSPPRLPRKCSLGCPILDSFLKGGIPCGSITELVGESASAKTQICLQLLLSAQMPLAQGGLQASSLYIHTEGYFPSRRLQQLAKGFIGSGKLAKKDLPSLSSRQDSVERRGTVANSDRRSGPLSDHGCSNGKTAFSLPSHAIDRGTDAYNIRNTFANSGAVNPNLPHWLPNCDRAGKLLNPQIMNSDNPTDMCTSMDPTGPGKNGLSMYHDDDALEDPCDNIFVQSIQNIEDLCLFLDQVHVLLSRPLAMPVRVLIIDSVAALFRSDFDNNAKDLALRTEWFFKLSSKLKQYAHDYDVAVMITNQVVDDLERESLERQISVDAKLRGRPGHLISANRRLIPALGIGWSHCINTRLFLSRTYVPNDQRQYLFQETGQTEHSYKYNSNAFALNSDFKVMASDSSSSVLQRLESELPDAFLLNVSHQRSTPSHCGVNDKSSVASYADDMETCHASSHTSLQYVHQRRDCSWNSECLPSCKVRRHLQVVFAPHLPASSCEFAVQSTQICGVPARFSLQALSK